MKLIIFPITISPLITVSCNISNQGQIIHINEYYIADADTIYFTNNNQKQGIRLIGIDAPETKKKNNQTALLENRYAQIAKNRLIKLLNNKPIKIIKIKVDKYNRWVAKVFNYQNIDISLKLVEEGMARVKYISKNKKDFQYWVNTENLLNYYDLLVKTEQKSINRKSGIWKYNSKDIFKKE